MGHTHAKGSTPFPDSTFNPGEFMPRSKDINRYPPQFMKLAEQFEADPSKPIPVEIEETDKLTPQGLVLELNSFRTALHKSEKGKNFPLFYKAELRIDGKKVTVIAKDRTPSAIAVGKALKGQQERTAR
jgi:hypothetical protein